MGGALDGTGTCAGGSSNEGDILTNAVLYSGCTAVVREEVDAEIPSLFCSLKEDEGFTGEIFDSENV